jgi:hypothetical protein
MHKNQQTVKPPTRALRTRFKKEIVAEFLPPANAAALRSKGSKRNRRHERVAIICSGMPGMPTSSLLFFLSKKGFWAIHPRYRGSWESDGVFLRRPLDEDVLDIVDELPRGFVSIADGKRYRLKPSEIVVFAGSFGGPAGILASRDLRITKVVAVSPVVDWRAPSKTEPLPGFGKFLHAAFGSAYRFGNREWNKLVSGRFYNPANHIAEIDGAKLMIFHAKDDDVVRAREVVQFARATGAEFRYFSRGGHFSVSRAVPKHWPQIAKFLRKS